MEEVLGIILLVVTIIVSLPVVGFMIFCGVDLEIGKKIQKISKGRIKQGGLERWREKNINIGQDIKDMNGEPKVRHSMSVFAVVKDENGEEREVDLRDIVGSRGEENK